MTSSKEELDKLRKPPNADPPPGPAGAASGRNRLAELRRPKIPDLPATPPEVLPRILYVDDEENFLRQTESTWRTTNLKDHAQFEVFHYTRERRDELLQTLVASIQTRQFYDAVYVDLNLVGSERDAGLGLIRTLREEEPRLNYVPFVAVTSFPDYAIEAKARKQGAIRFLMKTEGIARGDLLGIFVYRMITEARETREQAEDELWADASERLAQSLRSQDWRDACKGILDFLHDHFTVKAGFARELTTGDVLRQIHALDLIKVNIPELRVNEIPFIRDFMRDAPASGFVIIPALGSAQLGTKLPKGLVGLQAVMALVSVADAPLGLLSLYRDEGDRPFRDRDARGLRQLAMQLAAAISAEREKARLRARQQELLRFVREFDEALDEVAIHTRLQRALFEQIRPLGPSGVDELKATVRRVRAGTNLAERVSPGTGFPAHGDVGPISLEDTDRSATARAVWSGAREYAPDISLPAVSQRHIRVDGRIKASLTIPLMAQGICFGIASLESLRAEAFDEDDITYAEQLCLTAAAALLRLRTRRFTSGMADMAARLAEPQNLSVSDLIRQVVRLLTDFTHCSEILYLVPPSDDVDGAWRLNSVFTWEGFRLEPELLAEWRDYLRDNWANSYVRSVLRSGQAAAWFQAEADLPINDVGLAGRDGTQTTRSQAVIVVQRENEGRSHAMIALLFQHRHAVSEPMVQQLAQLGRLLASLMMQEREFKRLFGLNTVAEQEAMLGRVFGQVRHSLKSRLAKIGIYADEAAHGDMTASEASARINALLTEIDHDFMRNRALVKTPEQKRVHLGRLWDKIAEDLAGVAAETGGEVVRGALKDCVLVTDQDILESIFYNLVDNALVHGGKAVRVDASFALEGGRPAIRVHDNGRGIAASMRERLFEVGATSSAVSTGMGLYLSRERAKLLGAELSLESSQTGNTTFLLRFGGG